MWVQHFHLVGGEVRRRDPKDRPPGAKRLVTPYDPEARGSKKRDILWDGYKTHLTETCEPDTPHLITNVATTVATVPDSVMSEKIHNGLAGRDCLPGEHWVDTGYATASQIAAARREHGIELHGPLQAVTVAQAKNGSGYDQDAFTIDWDQQHVTCPNGATSTQWALRSSQQQLPVIRVRFSPADCRHCPALRDCVSSPKAERRELTLRQHDEHQAFNATALSSRLTSGKPATRSAPASKAPSPKASGAAACADPATGAWRRPAFSTSSPAPPSTSPASTPTSPKHPGPAPAPATSQHFAPPTKPTGRSNRARID
jgi:hypothetical protein